jgi:putative cell wall-binding protein
MKKILCTLLLVFSMICGTVCVQAGTPASLLQNSSIQNVHRLGGATRYDTAVAIAKEAFPGGAKEIILVSGDKFPDALSAAGFAGVKKCPVLITKASELSSQTKDLIVKWGVRKVTILGNTKSVSAAVENALMTDCAVPSDGITRTFGSNRYATAEAVADTGVFQKSGACVVTSGIKAADALSISPWAYKNGWPIFLADGKGNLSEKSLSMANAYSKVYVLGTESTVNARTYAKLKNAERIAGKNRYATSAAIAEKFSNGYNDSIFASGRDDHFPDPLVGGMLGGTKGVPIILADGLSGAWIDLAAGSAFSGVTDIYVLGGEAAVPKTTVSAIRGIKFGGIFKLAAGTNKKVDLNANGSQDTIRYTVRQQGDRLSSYTLNVNGIVSTTSFDRGLSVSKCDVYAADINISDGYKNIIVLSNGEDSMNGIDVFAYNDKGIYKVNKTEEPMYSGLFVFLPARINGSGAFSFTAGFGFGIKNGSRPDIVPLCLNNAFVDGLKITPVDTAGGTLEWKNGTFYFVQGVRLSLIKSIPLYSDSGCTKKSGSLAYGATVSITGCQVPKMGGYNLRVSSGGRNGWVSRRDLGKKAVRNYEGYN